MPDLKQICKPCPNIDNPLKPRKIINRLPDIDIWAICKDNSLEKTSIDLARILRIFNIQTSDVNPMDTFTTFEDIANKLKEGIMPNTFLPIDIHIIEYSKLKTMILEVPSVLEYSKKYSRVPYMPIHPLSYRKQWQYDDEAYNFIFDFLYSFTPIEVDDDFSNIINSVRSKIAKDFSDDELVKFILDMASDSTRRRINTSNIQKIYVDKMQSWRRITPVKLKKKDNSREDK